METGNIGHMSVVLTHLTHLAYPAQESLDDLHQARDGTYV